MNDSTLIVMAIITFIAYIPLKANIRKITGRENKVERGSIRNYFLVFLGCGLVLFAILLNTQGEFSSSGQAALIVIFFVTPNLLAHAFFGRKLHASSV